MTATLTPAQIRFLRGQAHELKPILHVGNKGVSSAFIAQLNEVLDQHELVKVRVNVKDRSERLACATCLIEQTGSHLIQRIGHMQILYRANPSARKLVLPRP